MHVELLPLRRDDPRHAASVASRTQPTPVSVMPLAVWCDYRATVDTRRGTTHALTCATRHPIFVGTQYAPNCWRTGGQCVPKARISVSPVTQARVR
jgi:hypothetical protein